MHGAGRGLHNGLRTEVRSALPPRAHAPYRFSMQAFYSDNFVLPLPPGHRFPMAKYQMLRDALHAQLPQVQFVQAPAAIDGELACAHHPAYIAAIADGSVDAAILRDIGFPWSPAMAERARRSVGGTLQAARVALTQGVSANLAGGTHHAYADRGGGFCVFNDLAVSARVLQAEWGRVRPPPGQRRLPLNVAIIDLDVHQGNGTARIFENDDSVFTLSMHGEKNFPFAKESSDLDVALPDGCTDDAYMAALEQALQTLEDRFAPGFVLYLAGADPHEGDRLGRLKLSFDGLQARDRRVFDWCFARQIPLAFAMGGGYGHDIAQTVQVQVNTYTVALEYWQRWQRQTAPSG
jgi:acetoin utilization deacetylase AcuC-like enzyme